MPRKAKPTTTVEGDIPFITTQQYNETRFVKVASALKHAKCAKERFRQMSVMVGETRQDVMFIGGLIVNYVSCGRRAEVPDSSFSTDRSGSATLVQRKTGASKAQNNDTQKLETDDKPVLSDALDNTF
ncbi:hypothetical protein E4U15_006702 [Claviceps sp. LM218 group G6]|nr:hypothetical protein E4U15_006702 [Claviceps sp. LM218 group G6]